ncbi:SocA family protein [bacterium]|nr:SocA family protein [bacterium]
MTPAYREDKATQAASLLLKNNHNKMPYLKLLKLMYLIDRKALEQWGRPITFDKYVSMDFGPVLSTTYNRINIEPAPGEEFYWHQYISEPKHYEVKLKKDPGIGALSNAEIEIINKIDQKYKHMDRFALSDLTHDLPEWQNPHGSSIPISFDSLLHHLGKDKKEAELIKDELDAAEFLNELK